MDRIRIFSKFQGMWVLYVGVILFVCLWFLLRKRRITLDAAGQRRLLGYGEYYMALTAAFFLASIPVQWAIKAPCLAVFLLYLWKLLVKRREEAASWNPEPVVYRMSHLVVLLLLMMYACMPLLFGGTFLGDWSKHRSVLYAIFEDPLCPAFSPYNVDRFVYQGNLRLVYYYAHYLPPALLVKLLMFWLPQPSPDLMSVFLAFAFLLWSFAGMVLTVFLTPVAIRRVVPSMGARPWGMELWLPFVFTDWKYWYMHFRQGDFWIIHADWTFAFFAQFGGFYVQWMWAPQHLVPTLLTGLYLFAGAGGRAKFPVALCSTYLFATTPFGWIGLLPFVVIWLCREAAGFSGHYKVIREYAAELAVSCLMLALLFFYYAGRHSPDLLDLNRSLFDDGEGGNALDFGLLPSGVWRYSAVMLAQLSPFIFIAIYNRWIRVKLSLFAPAALLMIFLLSAFEYGRFNDLAMRGLNAPLLILSLYTAAILRKGFSAGNSFARPALFIIVFFGAPYIITETRRSLLSKAPRWIVVSEEVRQSSGFPDPLNVFKDDLLVFGSGVMRRTSRDPLVAGPIFCK